MELIFDSKNISADKVAVAQAFSKAAKTYDQHAEFQRDVGQLLMNKLPDDLSGWRVLDLGCGTGYFTQLLALRGAAVTAFDISDAMLSECQSRCTNLPIEYLKGDAECLPFEPQSFDLVFSSLAIQWCSHLDSLMLSLVQMVKPHGLVMFSTLLQGSLFELKAAWQHIDNQHQHVNQFHCFEELSLATSQSGASYVQLDDVKMVRWYRSAMSLMKDLKGIGATHVSGRSPGLTKPQSLLQVEKAYQIFKNDHGDLPATYQVCLGVITK